METDSWGSFEQSMACCHNLGRQSKDLRHRTRSDPSHSVGCLNLGGILVLVLSG